MVGLADNEAYYWTWAKQLDWSYFDHPGMVAYVIAFTTWIGGDSPFFVRIGATLLFLVTTIFVYFLTIDIFKSKRAGFYSVILTNILPLFFVVGIIIIPDTPLAAFWAIFLYLLYKTTKGEEFRWWYWYLMGISAGLAILSKYFAILLLPSAIMFLASDKSVRKYLKSPHFYLAILLAALIATPILLWNVSEGWPSLTFHLDTRHGDGMEFEWDNFGKMIGGQMSMTPILLYFLLASLVVAIKRGFVKNGDVRYKFIALMSAPTLLFFYVIMCFTDSAEPHWPALGYIPLVICAAGLYPEYLKRWGDKRLSDFKIFKAIGFGGFGRWMDRTSAFKALVVTGIVFPLIFIVIMNVQIIYPIYRPAVTKYDSTNDFYVWDEAGERVKEIYREMMVEEGDTYGEPFIFSYHYNPASQLNYALRGTAYVWCLSRKTDQFDFWQDLDELEGRVGIYIVNDHYDDPPDERFIFDFIEGPEVLRVWRIDNIYLGKEFYIYRCYGFRGMK